MTTLPSICILLLLASAFSCPLPSYRVMASRAGAEPASNLLYVTALETVSSKALVSSLGHEWTANYAIGIVSRNRRNQSVSDVEV